MANAVARVRRRLERAVQALDEAGVPHAVAGDHAVAAWVARVDEASVRNPRDVELLVRRRDLDGARLALEGAGLVVSGVDGGVRGADRDAVHIVFAQERVRPEYAWPAPDVTDSDGTGAFRVLNLEALVRMKLTSFRRKDQVHLLDLIEVGLLDAGWLPDLPEPLAVRLQELLDNPDS